MAKLAHVYMDISDLDAAAPLMGALAGESVNVSSLKTRARFTFLRGDVGKAAGLMTQSKTLAGPAWTDESEATLKENMARQKQR